MHDTPTLPHSVTAETWRLRWDIVSKRCTALEAHTDDERAALMGISRATLDRWRRGTHAASSKRERRAAERLGLPRDAMWERAS
ncbi:hypothetical protein QTQ03_16495 [Micromonospora sp. WMMA1363]|uniref:hypothetical protein n=1 Tax=Micromonospora sp. WMMA1363 TaxID=3053985 RepID=UPI00259CCC56|nr:hypothetical protein [Micromonospora sp. WMMA1363]MDM4721118.1 hypothetical protein [Micromonospora sp. WMMA1363]